ncbi:MAG: VOC family protein [Planctomycetota bacterium]
MQNFTGTLDHLVVTAPSLESGAAWIERKLGCSLQPGGSHPRMGTHNQLLRIGPDCYLEVLAIDPTAAAPSQPRWFGLDRLTAESVPRLAAWVMRTPRIHDLAPLAPVSLGPVQTMHRGELEWLITIPADGDCPLAGTLPLLIQWQTTQPPATRLPESPLSLKYLVLRHRQVELLRQWFITAGFEGPIELVEAGPDESAGLTAVFQRDPEGELVQLGRGDA